MGVRPPAVGKSVFQTSAPVSTLNARNSGSIKVPAMKTRPPAVTIGPPRLGAPFGTIDFVGARLPSGTCHLIVPAFISTAASVPHGGATHGKRCAFAKIKVRTIPYGVPYWSAYSPCSTFASDSSSNLSRGIIRTYAGKLFVLTSSQPWTGSYADPLQFIPPTFPGMVSVPFRLGGVKIPSSRNPLRYCRQYSRSSSVTPHASLATIDWGTSAGGAEGNGCVGEVTSPGTSLCGTGFSSTGNSGTPVSRFST